MPDSNLDEQGEEEEEEQARLFHALSGYIVCKADFPSQQQTQDQASANERSTQSIGHPLRQSIVITCRFEWREERYPKTTTA
jgi:hypothetical protein